MKLNGFSTILASLAVVFCVSTAEAAEMKGVIKKIDASKNTLTITVDGADKVLTVTKDTSYTSVSLVPGKKNTTTEKVDNITDGLAGVKEGSKVTVLTDDDKVTSLKVEGGTSTAKPKKKKKTAK